MNMDNTPAKRPVGQRLTKGERDQLLVDMVGLLQTGYATNRQLAATLHVNPKTAEKLRPLADQIIAQDTPDRNIIRNLSVRRATTMIERLVNKLDDLSLSDELKVHDKIVKYSQHLALITGLNVETKINIDHKKLVITRAHPDALRKAIDEETKKNNNVGDVIDGELVDSDTE